LGIERARRIIEIAVGPLAVLNEDQFAIAVRRMCVPAAAAADLRAECATRQGEYSADALEKILREAVEVSGGSRLAVAIRGGVRAAIMGMTDTKVGWSTSRRNPQ
jgi:hypothetical protein